MSLGFLDLGNSTTVALGSGATFTGTGYDVSAYASIALFVDTDQDGTLYADFSSDGTNWDRTDAIVVDQTIGSGSVHGFSTVEGMWFRARYVNGSTEQTHLRLKTSYHAARGPLVTSLLDQIISRMSEVQLVRIANDPRLDVAHGAIADQFVAGVFGTNADVGTGAFEHIWTPGGTYPWPTAAETVRVKAGGNAADTAAGLGAQSITIEGLDENWEPASETVATAGSSASSATTTTFFRINRLYVAASGAYTAPNTGIVQVENTTSTNVIAAIAAGEGEGEMAIYTVRAGYDAYLAAAEFEVNSTKAAEVRMFQRRSADTVAAPFTAPRIVHRIQELSGTENWAPGVYLQFPEKTDLWVDAKASAGGATGVNARFDLELAVNNPLASPQ